MSTSRKFTMVTKLPRNVFVVRYRPDKRKKSVVFGTYDKLKYALYTMSIIMDWYDAGSFDINYIDSRGNSIMVFYWDRSLYGDK